MTVMHELRIAPRPRFRDRLMVRMRSHDLDARLASGTPPEASAALALRARRLASVPRRRELARSIQRLIREASIANGLSYFRISLPSRTVVTASLELTQLADRLAQPRPVSARGVAQAVLLLRDGTGPLYNPRSEGSLRDHAAEAADHLNLPA
jgi:hypothetical protein